MARWVYVEMIQSRPIDTGTLDTAGRAVLTFNAVVTKRPSVTFEEEVAAVLDAASVAVENVTMFLSSKAVIPTGAGPYLSILSTGGTAPVQTQNAATIAYERATVQIVVRGVAYKATRALAQAAFNALVVVRNQDVAA